jgi:cbb3-type cytochrome oxidase subunit 3
MILVTIGTVAFLLFLICVEFSHWDASKANDTEREASAERRV